ncbi:hypothetical protein [Halobacillus trueperi]|uniref:Uncharacterized protein n=1 Tax=Halobacillus trueperi TaxID=156205 RepID=A0A3E0J3Z8_9BACI|nr:hypothetical protein [Halobacillus trueperi]REJ07735.1 hypothetical protein DYE48_15310 [Halobacillus trueperi]
MPMREYRIVNLKNMLPSHQTDKADSTFKEIWKISKPKPTQCIKLGEYIILKNDKVQSDEVISVKTPDKQQKQKVIETYPPHLKSQIRSLEVELKLTQNHLKKIKKEVESEEIKQLKISKQIEFLKHIASELRTNTDNQNYIKRFRNRYSSFNECLDKRLKGLAPEEKEEVITLLDDLKERIIEVEKYIK